MKAKNTAILIGAMVFLLAVTGARAQSWKKLEPNTVKVLVDTTLLGAYEATIMPGEKGKVHTHAASFFYALTDCHLVVHYADGKDEKFDLKAGEYGYGAPERPHWTENTGSQPAKFLLVELKEHPYRQTAKK